MRRQIDNKTSHDAFGTEKTISQGQLFFVNFVALNALEVFNL